MAINSRVSQQVAKQPFTHHWIWWVLLAIVLLMAVSMRYGLLVVCYYYCGRWMTIDHGCCFAEACYGSVRYLV